MPFAVFRRHQKKMLAIFAILAMFGFVLSDSLYRFSNRGGARDGNAVVAELADGPVYRSDVNQMAEQRSVANRFLLPLLQTPTAFGGYATRELVDALILKREADRLGIPDTPEYAQAWLKQVAGRMLGLPMSKAVFENLLRQVGPDVGGSQVLACLASQVRLNEARTITGGPLVTPLDVFETYRDQNERSSFRFVSFPAANFLDKVGEPTDAEVRALYDQYKDVLPDPKRDTPGFEVPREVKLEVLTADAPAMAEAIRAKLAEADLKAYYDAHKAEFAITGDLPTDLFQGDPEARLTPARYVPFADVKDALAATVARERAQDRINEVFNKISDVIDDFSNKYDEAVQENEEAKKEGSTKVVPVPAPTMLTDLAREHGLGHEVTPLLTYEAAKAHGRIGAATAGSSPSRRGDASFADTVFAPKSPLFDGLEFIGAEDRRFLVRKLEDVPPHVAPLDEVRSEVVAAWRLGKARALAEAAARELAESVRKGGGKFQGDVVAGRPVKAIEGASKVRPGLPMPGTGMFAPPSLAELTEIPDAGGALRDALFGLKPGEVAVEPDAPKSAYYVLTLDRRDPATFAGLYGPLGSPSYLGEAMRDARIAEEKHRIEALRARAGLKPDWVPSDERDRGSSGREG